MKTLSLRIQYDADILTAREKGRALAGELGCSGSRLTLISTVISAAARRILAHSLPGDLVMTMIHNHQRQTVDIQLVARLHGADGSTVGLRLPTDWKSLGGVEVIQSPEETVLKWTEHLMPSAGEAESSSGPGQSRFGSDGGSFSKQDLSPQRDLRCETWQPIGDKPTAWRYFLDRSS